MFNADVLVPFALSDLEIHGRTHAVFARTNKPSMVFALPSKAQLPVVRSHGANVGRGTACGIVRCSASHQRQVDRII